MMTSVKIKQTAAVLFLLMFVMFGAFWQLSTGAQKDENPPTAIGDPQSTSIPGKKAETEPVVPDSRAQTVVANMDDVAFFPFISNHILGPEALEVFDIINAERTMRGCAPLRVSDQLSAAAQGHSEDMAHNDFFSHTSSDGRSPWERIRANGYRYWSAAENIAAGYTSAAAAVNGWMNSSGHRANILNCGLEETGVGYYFLQNDTGNVNYRHYWTQVFATPR